jgi:hypothetical protein
MKRIQTHTAISIKVVYEQSGKVEYERERLLGTTPRKNVCACVNITEICIANVMSSVPNVVKNSKWKPLRCFAFSMKMQAIIIVYMCKK